MSLVQILYTRQKENDSTTVLVSSVDQDEFFIPNHNVSMKSAYQYLEQLRTQEGIFDINVMIPDKPINYDPKTTSDIRLYIKNKKIFVNQGKYPISTSSILAEIYRVRDLKLTFQ